MSMNTQELKLRVEAKVDALKAQLKTFAADSTADAKTKKTETEHKLREIEDQIKTGWDKITDQAAAKINDWLK